jgi:hypothetical protein
MASSLVLQLAAPLGVIISASNATTVGLVGLSTSRSVRLDAHNFMLWKGLTVPSLAGADLLEVTSMTPQRPRTRP